MKKPDVYTSGFYFYKLMIKLYCPDHLHKFDW